MASRSAKSSIYRSNRSSDRLCKRKLLVERAFHAKNVFAGDMGVNHCCLQVAVPEELLNGSYVVAILEKMGCEAMPEGMNRGLAIDAGSIDGVLESFLQ